jgi:hypothetical protein
LEFAGQATVEHELEKKGLLAEVDTAPEKPALQEHPFGTLLPAEFTGQATAEQELV